MRKSILLLVTVFISLGMFAGFVPRKDAEKVAKSHYYQSIGSIKSVNWDDIKLICLLDPTENSAHEFYVFNINGDEGYVIVSSENKIIPILAYSFEGGFNFGNMAPGQKDFLQYFDDCISIAVDEEMIISEKTSSEWDNLLHYVPGSSFKQKLASPNLLKNINWDQGWPYNAQCPADVNATYTSGHVPVGCVATAMLQVMKYYNWPAVGTGSKYHPSFMNGGYGNITINFANQTYNWDAIPNSASALVNTELGKINYHASVSVSMYWAADGSGSQTEKIETALKTYFNYSDATNYVQKSSYTDANWKNLIKGQIDAKKPVVYSGSSTTTGHAWNCDGYQDDTYHMNWGWGSAGNGYYTLDNLISTANPGGPEANFNQGQQMVINIYPKSGYPKYCSDLKKITGQEGDFDDGSSSSDYEANSSCVYVIDPDCGDVVSVSFNDFDLGDGDAVQIYDGDENSTILLATYDSENLPASRIVASTKGAATIKFNTNSASQATGWNLHYTVKNCKTNMILTESEGSFDDGSGSCTYSNSSVCSWLIQPAEASFITLEFDSYDVAATADFVKIYKDSQTTANLLYTFNATNAPVGPLNIPSGTAVVQFFSDANNVGEGWSINYTSSTNDIKENKILSNMTVMPNPGNINSQLVFTLTKNTVTKFFITNVLGEVVAMKELPLQDGVQKISLNEIFNFAPNSGIYFINIDSGNEIITQKFVVL